MPGSRLACVGGALHRGLPRGGPEGISGGHGHPRLLQLSCSDEHILAAGKDPCVQVWRAPSP
eukprot:1299373-Prorocentrum_lima.AAC.1